jgi:nucleoside-diphosphate-sugar epimerase
VTKTALVTGASGFVGRHFTRHLRDGGWAVHAIDVCQGPRVTVMDALDYFRGPDPFSYDLVLHCAAVVGGRQVIDRNPLAQAVNLQLDAALFDWALKARPGRVIYFSSSAAYPVHLQTAELGRRLSEDDISWDGRMAGQPDQLYGWAKLTGELLARKALAEGLAVSVVRPFSGYGEDQGGDYPFAAFIDRALRREDLFFIWGDGNQVRDFIHIDDIVGAVMAMYDLGVNGPLNLGTGYGISMRQLALLTCELARYSPEFETVPSAPSGVAWRVADPARMMRVWKPKVMLDEGICRALAARGASITPA